MSYSNPLRNMAADLYKRWTLHILYPSRYRRLVKDRAVRDLADARFIFVNDYLNAEVVFRFE